MYYGIASAAHQINSAGYGDCVTQSPYYTFRILAPAPGARLCYKQSITTLLQNRSWRRIQYVTNSCITESIQDTGRRPEKCVTTQECNTKRDLQQTGSGTLQIYSVLRKGSIAKLRFIGMNLINVDTHNQAQNHTNSKTNEI